MRKEAKEAEQKILQDAYKVYPELFEKETFVENSDTLEQFGIYIPNKNSFPRGYLKLMPQDFIVEEVSTHDVVSTVDFSSTEPDMSSEGDTIFATLVKCGISTIEAINDIAQQIQCDTTQIQFAGIKDKDAITAQRISFRNVDIEKIKSISSPYFFLKDLKKGKGVMEKGGLKGNRFSIFIRTEVNSIHNVDVQKSLGERIDTIRKNGFCNFYYLQRFGTPRLINFFWGLEIIKGNYEAVIHSYLTFRASRELPYFRLIREQLEVHFHDWSAVRKILEPFPIIFYTELKIVKHLETHPTDYKGALQLIQEQTTLWVYAFSSLLFNEKLSTYIRLGRKFPSHLPLLLSPDKNDIAMYQDLLMNMGIFPPPLAELSRSFPFIRLNKRQVPTTEHVDFHKAEITSQGIALSFTLLKGDYATTFLAHLFNIIGGKVPESISTEPIDIKNILSEAPLRETIEHFKSVIFSKADNMFETEK